MSIKAVDTFYGHSHILKGVDIVLHENEIMALLGRNGAGKSTLLKTLIGIAPASNGSIELAGHELVGRGSAEIARLGIGYVPQGRGLFAGMTVDQNLELGRSEAADRTRHSLEPRTDLRLFSAHPGTG